MFNLYLSSFSSGAHCFCGGEDNIKRKVQFKTLQLPQTQILTLPRNHTASNLLLMVHIRSTSKSIITIIVDQITVNITIYHLSYICLKDFPETNSKTSGRWSNNPWDRVGKGRQSWSHTVFLVERSVISMKGSPSLVGSLYQNGLFFWDSQTGGGGPGHFQYRNFHWIFFLHFEFHIWPKSNM